MKDCWENVQESICLQVAVVCFLSIYLLRIKQITALLSPSNLYLTAAVVMKLLLQQQ